MVRIPAPAWAPPYARGEVTFKEATPKHYAAISPAERDALLRRRAEILALADAEVEEHANSMSAPAGQDWFPEQARLTGEFYIGSESYHRLVGETWVQVCMHMRCIGRRLDTPGDYLGLDVWLRYDPDEDRLWIHRNTDSMVI
jgi:hypothetical protein